MNMLRALCLAAAASSGAACAGCGGSGDDAGIRAAVRSYLAYETVPEESAIDLAVARVNLNGDPHEDAVVFVSGPTMCGSGGCNMLVLAGGESRYRLLADVTVVWPPIRVLPTKTGGWHDLSVWVQGGGIQPGHHAILRHDGTSYPTNPTVPPAIPADREPAGEVLITASTPQTPLNDGGGR